MFFEIEFLMNPENVGDDDDETSHFDDCNHINEILGKAIYIKKDDPYTQLTCNILLVRLLFCDPTLLQKIPSTRNCSLSVLIFSPPVLSKMPIHVGFHLEIICSRTTGAPRKPCAALGAM